MGGAGGVCGGANLCPKLYVDLYEAAVAKDFNKVMTLHSQVMGITSTLYRVGRCSAAFIKGLKSALRILGICDDYIAEPFHRFREEERERVRSILTMLGISKEHPTPV